jgi:hypothetical protein
MTSIYTFTVFLTTDITNKLGKLHDRLTYDVLFSNYYTSPIIYNEVNNIVSITFNTPLDPDYIKKLEYMFNIIVNDRQDLLDSNKRNDFVSLQNPNNYSDVIAGYSYGSMIINVNTKTAFICTDRSETTPIWNIMGHVDIAGSTGPTGPAMTIDGGITNGILLNNGGNIKGSTFISVIDNTINYNGTTIGNIIIDRNTNGSTGGQDLVLQAGGAFIGSTNQYGGSLVLKSGIMTGVGSTGTNNFIKFQQQLSSTDSTSDGTYINTRIHFPTRSVYNSINYDIITFNFTPNIETAVVFNMWINAIVGGATSCTIASGKSVVIKQSSANVITSTTSAMFTDIKLPNGAGSSTITWTVPTNTNTASIRVLYANLPSSPTYSYQSIVLDSMLYNPSETSVVFNYY